jgi:O-antigen/teichoic acid export membrane protein
MLTAGTNVVLGMLGVCTGAMVARLLGPHGRGELAAIQTWPMLVGYVAMLGTDQAVVYYSAREPSQVGVFVGSAAVISLVSCVPFTIITYLAMPFLLSAQSAAIIAAARRYLIIVPVVGLMSLAFFGLRGLSDFLAWNMLRLMPALAWAAVLVLAWFYGRRDPRVIAAAYLGLLAILLVPVGLVMRRRAKGTFVAERRHFGPLLRYGLTCFVGGFPLLLNLRLDQIVMAGLLSPSELGLYVVAVAWSSAINPLMNAVGAVLFPRVAGHGEYADRLRSFAQGSRLAALLALITTPVLFFLTPLGLVLLFGRKFNAAIPAGLILVPAGGIAALNTVVEEGFRGFGRPVVILHAELAGLVTTIVCLYLLLRPMGIVGASIASILGYSTVMAVLLFHVRCLTGESPVALLLPNSADLQLGINQLLVLVRRMMPAISRA